MAHYDEYDTTRNAFAPMFEPDATPPQKMSPAAYMRWLARKMREAVLMTQKLDAKWHRLNDELSTKLDAEGVTDVVQRDKIKSESLAFTDALNAGKWWREKAVYLASVLQAEAAYRQYSINELRDRS
jgi:hypothetical protein